MAVFNAGEFRKGIKVIVESDPYEMVHCDFVKPGKGQALYKCKMRNLLRGSLLDRTYRSGDSLEAADIAMSTGFTPTSTARITSSWITRASSRSACRRTSAASRCGYIKEGTPCQLMYWNEKLIGVTPPFAHRSRNHLYRAGRPRQHGHQRHEAGNRGNGRRNPGAIVHQRW